MGELVLIQGKPVPAFEYAGQRVTTFKQIDELHQRPSGTASRNFRANRQFFKEGHHYWELSSDVFRRDIGLAGAFSSKAPSGIVLSERGYFMLTKPFTDELSWLIQEEMAECFFVTLDENRSDMANLDLVDVAVQALNNPQLVLQAFERMAFHAKVLEDQIDILRPKAAFHDAVNASQGSMTVKRAAQLCGTGQNRMFRWLRDQHYLQAGNQPYQKWLDQGLFEMRIRTFNVDGTTFTRTQPLVTPKGLIRFQREMGCGEAVAFELDANVPGGVS